jgi:hypothetical protein
MKSGKTTEQIRNAPEGAIYIWPNNSLSYPREIAVAFGRHDITFVSPAWIRPECFYGKSNPVEVDHAAWYALTVQQLKILKEVKP